MLAEWAPWADEFDAIEDAEVVKLGTGHWPQFSQPEALGAGDRRRRSRADRCVGRWRQRGRVSAPCRGRRRRG